MATFGVELMPMTADEFGRFYRDDIMAIVKLAKDIAAWSQSTSGFHTPATA